MRTISAVLAAFAAVSAAVAQQAQIKERPLPRLVKKDGRFALFVDDAPYLILGAQAHNSSGWPAMLPKVRPAIEHLRANTLANSRPSRRKPASPRRRSSSGSGS